MTVKVNAVIYFRVIDPTKAVIEVANFLYATSQLAQTTLRSVLGEVELDELLSQREKLNVRLQSVLDQHTGPWGVKVTMVEVKQVDLAEQMIRAIARQAEAERERRAKIIHAEGEFMAAERLAMAAEVIQKQPAAIQLRYLQTLVEIGQEKNTTVVFPIPIDIFSAIGTLLEKAVKPTDAAPYGSGTPQKISRYGEERRRRIRTRAGQPQLLSVFFIVVILLGVFFTMGYVVGRNSGLGAGRATAPRGSRARQRKQACFAHSAAPASGRRRRPRLAPAQPTREAGCAASARRPPRRQPGRPFFRHRRQARRSRSGAPKS